MQKAIASARAGLLGLEAAAMSHSMPKWPNSAVATRKARRGRGRWCGPGRADVAADQLGRDQQLGPALDRLALQGVVGVAGPDPVGAVKDPQVDPARARAALDHLGCAQLVQQPVGGQGLGVDPGPAGVAGLDQVAVVVPLEEGDVSDASSVQPVADEGVAVGVGQVEHLPCAAGHGSRPSRPDPDRTQSGWARTGRSRG